MYDYPGTETDLIIHGSMGDIMDLTDDISENQNILKFKGGEYIVLKMEALIDTGYEYTRASLELLVQPLEFRLLGGKY